MSKKTLKLIKTILRYLVPAFVGWLEGDSHAIADALASLILLI